jgi:DNA-directed RNA polymerase subunit M/transcription elongation factor TFIIS
MHLPRRVLVTAQNIKNSKNNSRKNIIFLRNENLISKHTIFLCNKCYEEGVLKWVSHVTSVEEPKFTFQQFVDKTRTITKCD